MRYKMWGTCFITHTTLSHTAEPIPHHGHRELVLWILFWCSAILVFSWNITSSDTFLPRQPNLKSYPVSAPSPSIHFLSDIYHRLIFLLQIYLSMYCLSPPAVRYKFHKSRKFICSVHCGIPRMQIVPGPDRHSRYICRGMESGRDSRTGEERGGDRGRGCDFSTKWQRWGSHLGLCPQPRFLPLHPTWGPLWASTQVLRLSGWRPGPWLQGRTAH